MAQPAASDNMLDHLGPWTEEDFLALPEDRRIELLDGELLVSPTARFRHQRMSFRLAVALDAAATSGFEVLEAVNVRVGPGRILIPDLVIITDPGVDVVVADATLVAMVIEIMSPGSVAADRAIKPRLYAEAGIPHYLRIELGGGEVTGALYRLVGDRYVERERAAPGAPLALTEPFPVHLDLTRLARLTRPDA